MLCPFCKREIRENIDECPYCHRIIRERIIRNADTTNEDQHKVFYTKARIHQDGKEFINKILSPLAFLNKLFRRLPPLIIIILAIIIIGIFSGEPNENIEVKKFPPLEEPKTINFNWEYKDRYYALTEILYKTVDSYYHNSTPKECYCSENDCLNDLKFKQECYAGFLKEADEDDTISRFVLDIKSLGQQDKLNDDEVIELIVAFVQSIPYDKERSGKILSFSDTTDTDDPDLRPSKYPYETLFEYEGVCSDKSILAAALIKQFGYGVSLLGYPNEEHMALGIKCVKDYSSYNSGYCYAEVTNIGYRIGLIPSESNIKSNQPFSEIVIQPYKEQKENQYQEVKLGTPEIYEISDGRTYMKIIDTVRIEQETQSLLKIIDEQENQLIYYEQRLKSFKETSDYNSYNVLVSQYNALIKSYNNTVNKYNSLLKNLSL